MNEFVEVRNRVENMLHDIPEMNELWEKDEAQWHLEYKKHLSEIFKKEPLAWFYHYKQEWPEPECTRKDLYDYIKKYSDENLIKNKRTAGRGCVAKVKTKKRETKARKIETITRGARPIQYTIDVKDQAVLDNFHKALVEVVRCLDVNDLTANDEDIENSLDSAKIMLNLRTEQYSDNIAIGYYGPDTQQLEVKVSPINRKSPPEYTKE